MWGLFEAARVFCDIQDCPGYIGGMVHVEYLAGGIGRCTVSLIADDLIITNSHCVPKDSTELSMTDALFPRTREFPEERVKIRAVVTASSIERNETSPDYLHKKDFAVLRLAQPVRRTHLKIDRNGVPDNLKLTAYSADPITSHLPTKSGHQRAPYAKITKQECVSRQGTAKVPSYIQPLAEIVALGDCTILSGDSGSPLVDEKGEARAFAHGSISIASATLEGREIDTRLAYATNAACMDLGLKAAEVLPPACSVKVSIDEVIGQLFGKADPAPIEVEFNKWRAAHSDFFEWNLKKEVDPKTQLWALRPDIACIKDPKLWTKQPSKTSPLLTWITSPQDEIVESLPLWHFKGTIDNKLRLSLKVVQPMSFEMIAHFKTEDLIKSRSVKMSISLRQLNSTEAAKSGSEVIKICP